ncbi:MAG TPA: 3-ketoacyl-ACP reductase [Chthoniobacteraceae bacterium]|jgi:NAD(P)-dependent dehydrogenase (short-subunit alcohol dehydrogenase family)|nr:3-ketoacyl-ACP reductase [Chthoniobacteraceae bacterium]
MSPLALITGSSRGIGRGIALELAKAGRHDLVINYAGNETAARECKALCEEACAGKRRIEIVQADISLSADRDRMLAFVSREFGRLDLLVNNAGVAPNVRADILEAGEESFDRLIAINLKGPYFLTQKAAKLIAGSAPIEGAARAVVTVSSISAFTASTNRGDYCIAKAGLAMMTRLYAVRLAEFGIGVFEIQPGVIATDMTGAVKEKYDKLFAQGLAPINRWGEPSDIGKAVTGVALGLFPYSTGQVFNVDGGFHLRTI